jgi:hypothetical protein
MVTKQIRPGIWRRHIYHTSWIISCGKGFWARTLDNTIDFYCRFSVTNLAEIYVKHSLGK